MRKIFAISLYCLLFYIPVFSQEAQQFNGGSFVSCEDYLAKMNGAIVESQNNPTSHMYMMFYNGRETIYKANGKALLVFPIVGSTKIKISSMKKYIIRRGGSVDKFVFVEAGFREKAETEFWLVPDGAVPPKPSPTLTKMRYRKGRAIGYCLSCCGN